MEAEVAMQKQGYELKLKKKIERNDYGSWGGFE